jgi:hypothetical protein
MTNCILFYSILFYSILFYSILFYSSLVYSILVYSILLHCTRKNVSFSFLNFEKHWPCQKEPIICLLAILVTCATHSFNHFIKSCDFPQLHCKLLEILA